MCLMSVLCLLRQTSHYQIEGLAQKCTKPIFALVQAMLSIEFEIMATPTASLYALPWFYQRLPVVVRIRYFSIRSHARNVCRVADILCGWAGAMLDAMSTYTVYNVALVAMLLQCTANAKCRHSILTLLRKFRFTQNKHKACDLLVRVHTCVCLCLCEGFLCEAHIICVIHKANNAL